MTDSLPARPDLAWLRKRAKAERRQLRGGDKLAHAQLAVAHRYGHASWRALVAHVESLRARAAAPRDLPEALVAELLRRVGAGDTTAVIRMLADAPALANAIGPHPFWGGRPQPLHVAIDTAHDDMVKLLLRAGADPNGHNDEYSRWSPLLLAAVKRRHRARRMLLRAGAKVGLVEALALGDDERVLRVLRRGRAALPADVPSDGGLLRFARTPAAIDRLLALGESLDARDRWGRSPIDALSSLGRAGAPLLRHLASRGAAIAPEAFARIGDRRTLARLPAEAIARASVIHAAIEHGHVALVSWLLDRGADANARSAAGATCLHAAAWRGDLALVELLLARGADPSARDDEHRNTPAGWAGVAAEATNNPRCRDVAARLAPLTP